MTTNEYVEYGSSARLQFRPQPDRQPVSAWRLLYKTKKHLFAKTYFVIPVSSRQTLRALERSG